MLSDQERKVLDLVDENNNEIVEMLRRLVGFETVAPGLNERTDNDEYVKHQDFVSDTLKEMNFDVNIWKLDPKMLPDFPGAGVIRDRDCRNMPVLVGQLKGKGKGSSLILNGHYDVVVPGDMQNWSKSPFEGDVEDGKVFGRGTIDMKGGIAAMIQAVKFIQRAGIELHGDIIVQVVPEEEVSEMATLACCQKGLTADAAIIPEPTNMNILVAMRGSVCGKITVLGRSGHAAMPQPHWTEGGAVNAISKAAKIIQALEELTAEWRDSPDKRHKFLDPDIVIPTEIKGGDYWERYPEKVEITFSACFLGTTDNTREIEERIMSVANTDPWLKKNPPRVEVVWTYGAEIDENEPIVKTVFEAATELGSQPKLVGMGSQTDAIHLINYSKIPTISIGPDDTTAHTADEFIEIDQLIRTTKILALSILRWCGYS